MLLHGYNQYTQKSGASLTTSPVDGTKTHVLINNDGMAGNHEAEYYILALVTMFNDDYSSFIVLLITRGIY